MKNSERVKEIGENLRKIAARKKKLTTISTVDETFAGCPQWRAWVSIDGAIKHFYAKTEPAARRKAERWLEGLIKHFVEGGR